MSRLILAGPEVGSDRGSARPMRILIVHDTGALGGAEAHTLGLVRRLLANGDQVLVWTSLDSFAAQLREAGAEAAVVASHSDFLEVRRFPVYIALAGLRRLRLRRRLAAERLDAVYLSGLSEKLLVSRPAQRLGLPVFWTEFAPMTPMEPIWRGLLMRWYRRQTHIPSRVFTISEYSRDSFLRDGLFEAERVVLTYTGSDGPPTEPDPGALLREGPTVVCVSRLVEEKGQRVLVRALAHLPGATLLLGGDGPDRPALEALVEELGLVDRVELLGYVPDKWALLAAADVFCFPSTWTLEGFGIVSVEAMLLGKPVVATTVGPIPEVVEDGVTGICVAPGDPAALATALSALLGDPERAECLGRAGRERARRLFSLEAAAERTRSAMAEVVA